MKDKPGIDVTGIFEYLYTSAKENAILLMTVDGVIISVNQTFERIFGYTSEELKGRTADILFTTEDKEMMLPQIELDKVNPNGQSSDNNYIVHKNGNPIWVSGESILAKNLKGETFILKVIQNIHEIKLLQNYLQEANEFSENVLASISDAIVVIDEELRIHKSNKAFTDIFNLNEEVENLYLNELPAAPLQNPEIVKSINRLISDRETVNIELSWLTGKGTEKFFLLRNALLENDSSKRILLTITDITEKKIIEQKRDDVISFVTHELRNPLAVISFSNELILDSFQDNNLGETSELIQKQKENIIKMKDIITELYEATSAGSGNLIINFSTFNFSEILHECRQSVSDLYNQTLKISGNADVMVRGDKYRLTQVLLNYISNALKYSPPDSEIKILTEARENQLTVSVQDHGIGIPEDQQNLIFNRYYRSTNTEHIEGLGFGLFLAKEIVEAHKGKVWVESKVGEGAKFYFKIPV